MEGKNFSVWDLEKHLTKDITDSHINGEFHLTLNCGSSLKMSRSYKEKVKHFL